MNNFNKYLLVLLTLSAFALNSMEEQMGEAKRQKVEQPKESSFQPFSLKTQAARTISRIMTTGELSPEYLSLLPQELKRFVGLFNAIDSIIARKTWLYRHTIEYTNLIKCISETSDLLYKIIISESKHTLRFIAALDDFFDFDNEENHFKLTETENIKDIFATINMFAKIILDPQNAELAIGDCLNMLHCDECDAEGCIQTLALAAVEHGLVRFTYFILELNLICDRGYQLELFDTAFNHFGSRLLLIKLLKNKINITKHEFELMLNKNYNILWLSIDNLDVVKYLFKLIETFELDLRQIINKQYSDGETLLHKAIKNYHADMVEFLIAQGSDLNTQTYAGDDAISYALKLYNSLVQQQRCINIDDKNLVDISQRLLNIIELLRVNSSENNQN